MVDRSVGILLESLSHQGACFIFPAQPGLDGSEPEVGERVARVARGPFRIRGDGIFDPGLKVVFLHLTARWKSYSARICL